MERISISSVDSEIKEKIRIISRNKDNSLSLLMRKVLRQITEKYSHLDYKNTTKRYKSEININGVSKEIKQSIHNITDNMGLSISELVRMELFSIIEQASPDCLRDFQE